MGNLVEAGNSKDTKNYVSFFAKYGVVIALLFLIVLNIFITPNFLNLNNFNNIIVQSTSTMLVALSMTIVIATRGMDISVGSIMALSSVMFVMLIDYGIFIALLGAMIIGLMAGIFNGVIVSYFNIEPLILTLATMMTIRGIAQLITNGTVITYYHEGFDKFSYYKIMDVIPIQLIIVVIAIMLFYFIANRMTFGKYVEAIGDNLKAAKLSGINISLTLISVYALAGVMSGFSGLLETGRLSATDANNIGKLIELDAIAATAIGGTVLTGGKPYIMGTVAGVFIMQIITTMVNMNGIPYAYSMIVKTLIIIFAVYIQKLNR